jgi:tetratricopeptide (TPR) repeat protein
MSHGGMRTFATALLLLAPVTLIGCQDNESAIGRGDRLWADSSFESAAAEYRLAVAQRGDQEALARLAHAYALNGRLVEARDAYDELLPMAPELANQAAYDFLLLTERALRRGDPLDVAAGVEATRLLRPEIQLLEAMRPVARLHRERGDLRRAVETYHRALTALPPDSAPNILYEIGLLHEELEECETAIDYFRAFREQAEAAGERRYRTPLTEARWHTGQCAFRLAQAAESAGRPAEALSHLDHMIGLGEPENLLDQAWFDRGELMFGLGRYAEALESFRKVLERNPARTGQLVERAQQRIDDIRFGDYTADTLSGPYRPD